MRLETAPTGVVKVSVYLELMQLNGQSQPPSPPYQGGSLGVYRAPYQRDSSAIHRLPDKSGFKQQPTVADAR